MRADKESSAAVEALLFVSDEPVSAARIAKVTGSDEQTVLAVLHALAEEYRRDERGFQLREAAGGWRLYTHPAQHDVVERYVLSWDTRRLSQAALEALAVIAYHQPVTRAGVNAVRGVNSEAVISSLLEKGLVREAGRDRAAGNAILYATTKSFLEKFGLRGLDELPPLHEFAVDERTESELRERLGGRFSRLGGDADDSVARDDDDDITEID
ncbi:MAG TPA: SMC-Scp complex subunit ScpB [Coriobacteriia bacterium]|nr:SMC-Scp complex subunit ScpB [Coriobacteriia bacterium]